MKKFLMVLAVAALIASPAMAAPFGLQSTPTRLDSDQYSSASISDVAAGRTIPYVKNDPTHNYDNMLGQFGGPGPAPYTGGAYVYGGTFIIDDAHFRTPCAPSKSLTHMHFVFYNPASVTSAQSFVIAFFSNTGADLTPSVTLGAFQVGPVPAGFRLLSVNFATLPVHIPDGCNVWVGIRPLGAVTQILAGGQPQTLQPGANGAFGIGSGHSISYLAGAGGLSSYIIPGNYHITLGKPEPVTAVLLGIGGLLALRRRKVA